MRSGGAHAPPPPTLPPVPLLPRVRSKARPIRWALKSSPVIPGCLVERPPHIGRSVRRTPVIRVGCPVRELLLATGVRRRNLRHALLLAAALGEVLLFEQILINAA